jgi:NADH-ubiquinone oxidoreductase chain 6
MAFVLAITGLFIYIIKWILPFSINDVSSLPEFVLNQTNNLLVNFNLLTNVSNNVNYFSNPYNFDSIFTSFLQIETLGEGLYTYGAPLLIISSIVLLLSMISPIFISGKFRHLQ